MSAGGWLYVVACLVVPAAWGAASAWLFSRADRHRDARERERPPIDYMI